MIALTCGGAAQAGALALNQTHYRLRAGESTFIDAPAATRDFVRSARTNATSGFALGPSRDGSVVIAVSPLAKPGRYGVAFRAIAKTGEMRSATITVDVDAVPPVPLNSTVPPIVFLDGWQLSCPGTLTGTFGALPPLLQESSIYPGNAAVYFFDNCAACPGCTIEALGALLGQFIASLVYQDGTPVPQVDLVAHSMGGLIVRAYLSGKQTSSGVFLPPASTGVRKAIFIATPHFGSYQADTLLGDLLAGTQTAEMTPGSQFLWDLATWNQGADDLRGVDALAIIGNAGAYPQGNGSWPNASDGLVSLTSASLDFASSDQRTRIVPYCHISFSDYPGAETLAACDAPGIADSVTLTNYTTHPTFLAVQSFLSGTSAWQSTANAPSQDQYLSVYGGVDLVLKSPNDTYYADVSGVQFDNGAGQLSAGPSNTTASIYYDEFIPAGSHSFSISVPGEAVPETAAVPAGGYHALRFKDPPAIYNVQSSLSTGLPGLTVASGSTITISGVGFSSTGTEILANGVALSSQIASDQQITALLPANIPSGLVSLTVSNGTGQDAVNIVVAPPALPAFFTGETPVGGGLYYLQFPDTNLFGYYGYLSSSILYHADLGYEGFISSAGSSIYFYDFASGHWWYSSAGVFPYLYDFTLGAWLYYFPDAKNPGHYTANPRYFVNLGTQTIFTM